MRPIKFRGRSLGSHSADAGKMVFAELIQNNGEVSIFDGKHFIYVEPESVAQLVGYDADNREVYEGDIIIDDDGNETPAMLFAIQFSGKLKEAAK